MKSFILSLAILAIALSSALNISTVAAETNLRGQINDQIGAGARSGGLPTPADPRNVIATVINIALGLIGTMFLVLTILGGYWYLTAKGDETQVEKGKETMKAAIFGLIIVMVAYSITIFVTTKFSAAVQEGGQTEVESRLP